MLSGARPIAIWLLESGLIALILFLLWHPALSIATLRPQQNVVAVLVDDSRSMSINDANGTREAAAKATLDSGVLKGLSDRFQVRLYRFGREPERIQKTDAVDCRRTGLPPGRHPGARAGRILLSAAGRDRAC